MSSSKSKEKSREEEWIDLRSHPIFNKQLSSNSDGKFAEALNGSVSLLPRNLIAYDGASCLLLWNSSLNALQSVDIRSPDPFSDIMVASTKVKVLRPSMKIDFLVQYISVNRSGTSIVIASDKNLAVMYLGGQKSSTSNEILCRTVLIGSRFYVLKENKGLQILQVAWHPQSDTHLGILSSDSVFRIFDLSSDLEAPEQEYHLQTAVSNKLTSALQMRPIAFAFGGEHFWDRFTVFFLFKDSSVYAICPVVPFGSVFDYVDIEVIYKDASTMASRSNFVDAKAGTNCSLAVVWLQAVFPELDCDSDDCTSDTSKSLVMKAQPYVLYDACVMLQGPLPKVRGGNLISCDDDSNKRPDHALCFLYNTIGMDSFLAIAFSEGQLEVYALLDEIQPRWNFESIPRLGLSDNGQLKSVAMVLEARSDPSLDIALCKKRKGQSVEEYLSSKGTVNIPPLLRAAEVELSLPASVLQAAPLSLLSDPIIPERLYCYHGGGIDAILINWLPFSDRKNSIGKDPAVFGILNTCPTEHSPSAPLLGITVLLDTFGKTWLIAVSSSSQCAVKEMKPQREFQPILVEGTNGLERKVENSETETPEVISRELLIGPKDIPFPQLMSAGKPLTATSIEGRSILNDYCKMLHENHVEYAHKVYVELKQHSLRLKKAVDDQQRRLQELQGKLQTIQMKDVDIKQRIAHAMSVNGVLEESVRKISELPGVKTKPLTAAEREFKSLMDMISNEDLNVMGSAIDVLSARFDRYMHLSQQQTPKRAPSQRLISRNLPMQDSQLLRVKKAVEKLSKVVEDASSKANLVEVALKARENMAE